MANTPQVKINFSNGNLLQNIQNIDGLAAIVCTGTSTAGIPLNTPVSVYSLADAEAKGVSSIYIAEAVIQPAVTAVAAQSGNLAVSTIKALNDEFLVTVGGNILGSYTQPAGATVNSIATGIAAAINAATATNGGYTAAATTANVRVTAPVSAGAAINGTTVQLSYPGGSAESSFTGGVSYKAAVPAVVENDSKKLHTVLKEFYGELGGNQQVIVMIVPRGTSLDQLCDANNTLNSVAKVIDFANGDISLVAIARGVSEVAGGTGFFASDVTEALLKSKPLFQGFNAANKFARLLIEGIVANQNSPTIADVKEYENDYAGVVLGGSLQDGSASVGLVLGRAVKYAAHIKVGKVANGALSVPKIYIGSKPLSEIIALDTLHGKGVISFVTHPGKAGFYLGVDNMANTGDYRLLAHARVVDAAARVALSVFINQLEAEVETSPTGTIADSDADYLEAAISQQVNLTLSDRISGFEPLIDRTVNIINTSQMVIKLRVRPRGYLTWIEVDLGLTAG